jgi:hypothetical protein
VTGRLPTFEQRKAQARSKLENEYDFSGVEKQYAELITAVSEPPNGISKDDFYDPPISEIGGWKRAQDQFTTLTPQKMISEFRDYLCDIVGNIEGDYTPIEETGTQQESESKS